MDPAPSKAKSMMIEVRTFEGSAEELSEFVVNAWRSAYAGKMLVPNWTADYLRWQLRLDEPNSSQRLVAAYSGTDLAGVMLHVPMEFDWKGRRITGSQASWLSVDSRFKGQGVASALQSGTRKAHIQQGLDVQVGYIFYGAKASQGPKFWLSGKVPNLQVAARVGFWTRVLDAPKAARWNVNPLEAFLTRIAAPITFEPHVRSYPNLRIRPFEPTDLPRCLELAEQATRNCDFRLVWNADRLGRQLQGFGKCLVAEEDGDVKGCIGYHVLSIHGHTLEPVGILDLVFVDALSARGRSELLNSALLDLRQAGAVVALKLRSGDYPVANFMRWGWFWRPSDSLVSMHWTGEIPSGPPTKRLHLLWR